MKKLLFCVSFLLFFNTIQAQVRIGLQLSPAFSINRVESESDSIDLTPNGAGLKIGGGPVIDFLLRENYYFSTGLFYYTKRAGFTAELENQNREIEEVYHLQYLRIPLTLRLFTNEIALDRRIYFRVGLTGEIKLNERDEDDNQIIVERFSTFDGSALIEFGLEYRVGYNTTLFGGFSYTRGLINVVDQQVRLDSNIESRNDLFAINFGVFF